MFPAARNAQINNLQSTRYSDEVSLGGCFTLSTELVPEAEVVSLEKVLVCITSVVDHKRQSHSASLSRRRVISNC